MSTRPDTLRPDTTVFRSGSCKRRLSRWVGSYSACHTPLGTRKSRALTSISVDIPWIPTTFPRGTYTSCALTPRRSEEHTSELQSLLRISYAVFCLKENHHRPKIQTLLLNVTYRHH